MKRTTGQCRSRRVPSGAKAVVSAIRELVRSHAETGWDGGHASAADPRAIARAVAFVRALPEDCVPSGVGIDPDGSVSLDWNAPGHRVLTISVSGHDDRLACAWIDGADSGHAVAGFDGDEVPAWVKQAIRAVTEASSGAALRIG